MNSKPIKICVFVLIIGSLFPSTIFAASPQQAKKNDLEEFDWDDVDDHQVSLQKHYDKLEKWNVLGKEAGASANKAIEANINGDKIGACKYQREAKELAEKGVVLGKDILHEFDFIPLDKFRGGEKERQAIKQTLVHRVTSAEQGLKTSEAEIERMNCFALSPGLMDGNAAAIPQDGVSKSLSDKKENKGTISDLPNNDNVNIVIPKEVLDKVLGNENKEEKNIDQALNVLLRIGLAAALLVLWDRWKKK